MTDAGRKGMGEKASEAMQPDSSKSTMDKAKEGVTDMGDKVARGGPDSEKSGTQAAADKAGRGKDDAQGKGIMDQAKDAVGMGK